MRLTRNEINSSVSAILNSPVSLHSPEIEYIPALDDQYQELAIYQAAMGQAVRAKLDDSKIEMLQKTIKQLSEVIYMSEVNALNSKNAWADKYGNLKYVTEGNKIKAKLDDVPLPSTDFICNECGDTGIKTDSYSSYSMQQYPCSCEKGQKKAKNTNYMGPVTGPVKSFKVAKSSTKNPLKELAKEMSYKLGQTLDALTGASQGTVPSKGVMGDGKYTIVPSSPQPVTTKPELVEVPELKIGRKFRNVGKD